MKKLSNLLAALVFVSLVIFISCNSSNDPTPVDPLDEQATLLSATWNVSNVRYNTGNPDVSWDGFVLTVSNASASGGNYSTGSTTPDGFSEVWPGSGTWTFGNTTGSVIDRNDGIEISITNLTTTSLTLTFDIPESSGRTAGIPGAWEFTFTAAN